MAKSTPNFLPVVTVITTIPGEVLTTALPLLKYVLAVSVYYTQLVRGRPTRDRTLRTRGTTAVAKGTPLMKVEVILERSKTRKATRRSLLLITLTFPLVTVATMLVPLTFFIRTKSFTKNTSALRLILPRVLLGPTL